MSNFTGRRFATESQLTNKQLDDLNRGFRACEAFWMAALDHPSYEFEHLRPHGRCIYSALSVRDILRNLGRTDATVQKVGLDVRRYAADKETLRNGLAVGHPRYVQMGEERRWNAHLVVRLGDVFIDPSMSQARRPWNKLPDFGVIIPGRQAPSNLEVEGEFTKTKAFWEYKHEFEFIQIRYFELLRAQDIPTRGFLSAPDAKPEARNDVVGIATSVLAKQRR